MTSHPTFTEASMVNPIEPGDIPHEIQRDVVAAAIEAAAFALRQSFEDDPAKAARLVAEAAVAAWQIVNGVSRSPSPSRRTAG
ncbi:hypothetical protein [Bordetella bronchiseptica]|uniref:hypothetical protein n=1 Tax=Bordetella bronchiseptica TaxID=518 RepID=UPI001F2B8D53|nr:hypothetical protein [Bordetella bronchiseptica]